jgi:tetratricopeptide (TPR) repeat protein
MKRTAIMIIIAFLVFPVLATAGDAYVDYLEGVLEVQISGNWQEVGIGDEISSNAKLKLSDEGYAELLVGDSIVSLSRDGTYNVNELIKGSASVANTSLDLKKKITLSSGYEKWQQEATMGVRGAEATVSDSAGMEDAYTYLEAGLKSLDESDYEEALINFEEGWDYFEDQNCLFFAAVCYDALGQKRAYTKSLQEIQLKSLEPGFQSAYVIRMSDLLIRSLAYKEAVDMISSFESKSAALTKEEAQQIQFLKGTAFLGSGNKQNARSAFKQAQDIAPSTPLGEQASKALSSL